MPDAAGAAGPTMVMIVAPTNRGHDPGPELEAAIEHLHDHLARHRPAGGEVMVAVLGGDATTIAEGLDHARERQPAEVIMVSAQTVTDRSFDAWCKRIVGHWIRTRQPSFPILLAPPLAHQPGYLGALTEAVDAAAEVITDRTAPLLSPAWETVPGFSRHVLVCRGPRCSAQGAAELSAALADGLAERGLGDDDVLVTLTGCLFPCNQGPVLVVYPDNSWYAQLEPSDIPRLIEEHLQASKPLTDRLAPRTPSHSTTGVDQ